MKIGIVLHPYGEDKPAGLGRAIYEITKNLIEVDEANEYVVILRKKPKTLPEFRGKNWKLKVSDRKYLWLDFALWGEKLDVCIFNTPIVSFFIRPKKTVVITHDYAYEDFGGNRLVKLYNYFSLKVADLIISISEATKKETVKLFGISESKIKVVYLGYENICALTGEGIDIPEKFLFFVGAIKERKNVLGIVKAFEKIKKDKKIAQKLVICGNGKGPYYDKVLRHVKDNRLEGDIVFVGHISDNQLSYLYKHATALIYPSFIEGFGFPVLEAMACGLPVITSNSSSLPEVAGEAAITVDPNNIEKIADAIFAVVSDDALSKSLIEKGVENIKRFSWHLTAINIKDLINLLCKRNQP